MSERTGPTTAAHARDIGAHSVRFEPPDLVYVTLVGDASEDDVREILGEIHRLTAGSAGYYELVDMTHLRSISSAARRVAIEPHSPDEAPLLGAALHGAKFHLRVMVFAIQRVMALMGIRSFPVAVFDSSAEALAWIAARRQGGAQAPHRAEDGRREAAEARRGR